VSVVRPTFTPPAERRSALDRAHLGDIEGALGTIGFADTAPRRSLRQRLATLLAIAGPGLIVMAADNDAGGIAVYAQAGQNHGAALLWILVLLAPVLFINQEMVARLGAVTGAGHARLIVERFGRRWGAFAVSDLLLLNALTLVTEFIGVALALDALGIGRAVSVPLAGAVLIAIVAGGSFRRWERAMYLLVALNALAIALAIVCRSHLAGAPPVSAAPDAGPSLDGAALLFVIAMIGTTVAPWQLFLQQSNVVDKRITARWLTYARIDTLIGTVVLLIVAGAVLLTSAWAFAGTPLHGGFRDAGGVAHDLATAVSPAAGTLFALALLNASLIGAAAVTLSSSYAVGDYFGYKHSLHRDWRDARVFHRTYAGLIAAAAVIVVLPGAPLGLITTGVQALAGVLLPSASVFLLLLCNDRAVLGPWVNPRWLNAIAAFAVGVLVVLSTVLIATTVFPHADPKTIGLGLVSGLAVVLALVGALATRNRPPQPGRRATQAERQLWTMPRLDSLAPPPTSRSRQLTLVILRVQLLVAAALLVAKLIDVGLSA
jgi:NRAMP (natural resistance-associated macrophage protein)-like metal ion transporter